MTAWNIEDIGPNYYYRYQVDIPRDNTSDVKEVIQWCHESGLDCMIMPGRVYFRRREDIAWFQLKWR